MEEETKGRTDGEGGMMTEEELTKIEDRANKATPGKWREAHFPETDESYEYFSICSHDGPCGEDPCSIRLVTEENDAKFIAAARQDVPALLAEVRRLKAERVKLAEGLATYIDELREVIYYAGEYDKERDQKGKRLLFDLAGLATEQEVTA